MVQNEMSNEPKKIKAFSLSGWQWKQQEMKRESLVAQHSAIELDRTNSFLTSGILGKDFIPSTKSGGIRSAPAHRVFGTVIDLESYAKRNGNLPPQFCPCALRHEASEC